MTRTFSLVIIFSLSFCAPVMAQDRYMVFFADKAGSSFSLQNPSEFLSERALQRRQRQSISLVENDLPVVRNYILGVKALGAEVFFSTKWMNGVLVQMPSTLVSLVEALPYVSSVEFVAPNAPLASDGADADGGPARQMEDAESDFQHEMLGIDEMHRAGYEGQGLMIGVFDEGFDRLSSLTAFDHLFENNRIVYTRNFTTNTSNVENTVTHGRRVLSVLAARAEGELVGAAPEASYILSVTEAPGEYRIEEYNWLFAAEMADSAGVDIINTSLGYNLFTDPSMDYTLAQMDGQTAVITRAANIAASKGIALATSAGNTGLSLEWPIITAPGDSPNVLAVGSVNSALQPSRLSSRGPSADGRVKPDVAALGVATAVIGSAGTASFSDGTSFASPLVTGLMAGVWQAFPELTAAKLIEVIRLSGHQYDSPDNEMGYGIPDFLTAVRVADEIDLPVAENLVVYPNPVSDGPVNLAFNSSFFDSDVQVTLVNSSGQRLDRYQFTPTTRDNRILIDLGIQPAGIYLLRVNGMGGTFIKKVIKY